MLKPSDLHVVAVHNNPRRYKSRDRLLREFIPRMLDAGTTLTVVTHAFGEREPVFGGNDEALLRHVNHVQLRGGPGSQLWLKEALVNAGVRRIADPDWKYLAWIDADIEFTRPNWAMETLHMLQHHQVGQPWSHAVDFGPNYETITNEWGNDVDRSFAAAWVAGDIDQVMPDYGMDFGLHAQSQSRALLGSKTKKDWRTHFGYAWAIRREAYRGLGGLIDWLITGSGDYHMAMAFAGNLVKFDEAMSPGYIRRLKELALRADRSIRQDIGVVPGTIHHYWHGRKKQRHYLNRFEIFRESGYDPDLDLAYDEQGLPTLARDNRVLRDGLRRYDSARNEDSIDTE